MGSDGNTVECWTENGWKKYWINESCSPAQTSCGPGVFPLAEVTAVFEYPIIMEDSYWHVRCLYGIYKMFTVCKNVLSVIFGQELKGMNRFLCFILKELWCCTNKWGYEVTCSHCYPLKRPLPPSECVHGRLYWQEKRRAADALLPPFMSLQAGMSSDKHESTFCMRLIWLYVSIYWTEVMFREPRTGGGFTSCMFHSVS